MTTKNFNSDYDERGYTYIGVDRDIYDRIRTRLIRAILEFNA